MHYVKKFFAFVVAWLFPPRVAVSCGGVLQDGNVPAFQSGFGTMANGGLIVGNVYLTPRSFIKITRLEYPADPANAGELRVNRQPNPIGGSWTGGYGKAFAIESTDAIDAGLVQWVIITAPGMGVCYPGVSA